MVIQKSYTYLLIDLLTIIVPFLFSFEKKMAFYKKWKALFPALAITGAFFIIWDLFLTEAHVWSFNPEYLTGISLWSLPLEEWLFFFAVPYSCVFIYESLNVLLKKDVFFSQRKNISVALIVIILTFVVSFPSGLYTITQLPMAAVLLAVTVMMDLKFMGKFYRAYLVSLIPFLIVNGILTALPVVMYNDNENSGLRVGSIPAEDLIYSMLLLLMNIALFECFKDKRSNGENILTA